MHLECTSISHTAPFPTLDMTGFEAHIARSIVHISTCHSACSRSSYCTIKACHLAQGTSQRFCMPIKDLDCNFRLRLNVCSSYCIATVSIRPTDLAQIIVKHVKVQQQFSCQGYRHLLHHNCKSKGVDRSQQPYLHTNTNDLIGR